MLTLLDQSDVYMTIFVPASVAGPLGVGDGARFTLDPLPGYVFPAQITFVATEAQFTPKTVETAEEREKLMFRVKLWADPELQKRYEKQVKPGVRGIGYVRTRYDAAWPEKLAVKLPCSGQSVPTLVKQTKHAMGRRRLLRWCEGCRTAIAGP